MTAISAFQKANLKNAVLLFLGDGECRHACESVAARGQNIRLVGRVDNVQEYLCASDYFLSASIAEGLPILCWKPWPSDCRVSCQIFLPIEKFTILIRDPHYCSR